MPRKGYNKGARKAMAAFRKRYGAQWKARYYGRANKLGSGKTMMAKANSVYGKGKHPSAQKRNPKRKAVK